MKKLHNYGLKLSEVKPEDYILGGFSTLPTVIVQETGQWDEFLPQIERQSSARLESQGCVSFGSLNCIEMLVKRLYNLSINYSDRWLVKISGTDPNGGNSPSVVLETLRKIGVPFQARWDFGDDIDSVEKFYENPPVKLYDYA